MQFQIRNRWSGEAQVTAEIKCTKDTAYSIKLGLAVKWALKRSADLMGADLMGADLSHADLRGANLSDVNLRSADLRGADLMGTKLSNADLMGANLSGTDLSGTKLRGAKNIPDDAPIGLGSLTLKQFRDDIVPPLLTATGKTIPDVLATGCWGCHDWANCPMHVVFGVNTTVSIPALWRPYAEVFVRLFDAHQLPKPTI